MTEPLTVTSDDLALYLDQGPVNEDRAELLLRLATNLCLTICNPLPAEAEGVVLEVASRAYANIASNHSLSLGSANASFGSQNTSTGIGGLYLSASNERTLRRLSGRSGAFDIDMMPPTAGQNLPYWDRGWDDQSWINGLPTP